jgi:hypothetical protein
MANPDRIDDEAPDDKLAALGRAIAYELLQIGYRPAPQHGRALLEGHPPRTISPKIWQAMKDILAGGQP